MYNNKEFLKKLEQYIKEYKQLIYEFRNDNTWFKPWLRLELRSCQILQKKNSLDIFYDEQIPPWHNNQVQLWYKNLSQIEQEKKLLLNKL